MSKLKYRREIDGLRAVAVIPVILFHLEIPFFQGGYIGVDIFFVISGYLITSIIFQELIESRFSIISFYERRIRRIIPVFSVVILTTIPFSWVFMLPEEFKDYLLSILSSTFFFSNILFWNQSDYFDRSAEFKPLLHTWSLSIEEQFYILFPAFLIFLFKFYKRRVLHVLSFFALISFILSWFAAYNYQSANFYLLPTRAWEILAGSIIALVFFKKKIPVVFSTEATKARVTEVGIIMIVVSFLIFNQSSKHPGGITLLPILGTILILLSTPNTGILSKILSSYPMVGTGLLSYSLYLWHVPIITFIKLKKLEELNFIDKYLALSLTIGLSLITYNFVEKRFKNKTNYMQRDIFKYFFITSIFFVVLSSSLFFTEIFTNNLEDKLSSDSLVLFQIAQEYTNTDTLNTRYDDEECKFFSLNFDNNFIERFDKCKQNQKVKATLLLGDSHAMNLHNIIFLSTETDFFVTIANGGSRPKYKNGEYTFQDITEFINQNKDYIELVYYHQSGSHLIYDYKMRVDSPEIYDNNKTYKINTEDVLLKLKYLNTLDVKSVWIGPFVEYREDVVRQILNGKIEFLINQLNIDIFKVLDTLVLDLNNFPNVDYIPFDEIYKIDNRKVFLDDCLFFRDQDHLSVCAENIIGKETKYFATVTK